MKFLSCFIKEVMRVYTPVPVAAPILTRPLVLDGITVPSGTAVDFGLYHIHHHPDVWPEPYKFKPERFETEDILNKDPYSFVPFSAGPRNCIGQNFALNEDKVMISRIVNSNSNIKIEKCPCVDRRIDDEQQHRNLHITSTFDALYAVPTTCILTAVDKPFALMSYTRFEIALDLDHEAVPCIGVVLHSETGIHLKLKDRRN